MLEIKKDTILNLDQFRRDVLIRLSRKTHTSSVTSVTAALKATNKKYAGNPMTAEPGPWQHHPMQT